MSNAKANKFFANLFHSMRVRREKIKTFETAYRKFCRGCSTTKTITEFYKSEYHSGGHRPRCKACVIKYSTERKRRMKKEGTKDVTTNDRLRKANAELVKSARLIADYLENEHGDTDGVIECRRMADKHEVKQ